MKTKKSKETNNFYRYKAKVLRVVDGDTIDAKVELGFNINLEERFRLIGFDAPETYRPKSEDERSAGLRATETLQSLIGDKEVIIESNKHGKYRWLATVYLPSELDKSINQLMIELGHVK